MIREIALDTEFLEAGRNPLTHAAQIMPASIALVDVFNKNAFYGVAKEYTPEHVEKLLQDKTYSTLPDENPELAQKLLNFQRHGLLPKILLEDKMPNSKTDISILSRLYNLDYRLESIPDLANSLIDYLKRTKGDETHIRLWARNGASDQIIFRSFYDGLTGLSGRLQSIGLKLVEGEMNDLPNRKTFIKPPDNLAHNCLFDAGYDAANIRDGLS